MAFVGLSPIVGVFAAASTIAGNLTLFGAASNIIIIEAAESRRVKAFSYVDFLKIGSIVTVTNLPTAGI